MKKGDAHDRFRVHLRRERRTKLAAGWQVVEPDWQLIRGARWQPQYVILQASISLDGKSIFFKTGERRRANWHDR